MTSGVYKIEQFYLNNCKNEKDFKEKINAMNLSEIREIVNFPYIIREGNPIFLKRKQSMSYSKKLSLKSHGNIQDQSIANLKK